MTDLSAITHANWNGYWDGDKTILTFKRVNPAEATHTIVEAAEFRSLVKLASDQRVLTVANNMTSRILSEILELVPDAAAAYFRSLKKIEEEQDADV